MITIVVILHKSSCPLRIILISCLKKAIWVWFLFPDAFVIHGSYSHFTVASTKKEKPSVFVHK